MNKILVAQNEKKKLKDLFGCSYPTVRESLNGQKNTLLAMRIRRMAIERGGMEVKS